MEAQAKARRLLSRLLRCSVISTKIEYGRLCGSGARKKPSLLSHSFNEQNSLHFVRHRFGRRFFDDKFDFSVIGRILIRSTKMICIHVSAALLCVVQFCSAFSSDGIHRIDSDGSNAASSRNGRCECLQKTAIWRRNWWSSRLAGLPFYTVGRFMNTPCVGSNQLVGTCMLRGECKDSRGLVTGSCNSVTKQAVCCTRRFSHKRIESFIICGWLMDPNTQIKRHAQQRRPRTTLTSWIRTILDRGTDLVDRKWPFFFIKIARTENCLILTPADFRQCSISYSQKAAKICSIRWYVRSLRSSNLPARPADSLFVLPVLFFSLSVAI